MGFFDGITLDDFKALEPAAPPAPSLVRSAADTGLSLARGAVQGVKMLSDATGAGNPVSETLQRGIDWLSNNFSDYSQWEQLTSAQDQKAAALSGSTWEEIKAAARSFGKRPIDFLAEAAGTSIPTIAAAFLPGGQGAVLGRVAMLGMGGAQGAGSVKGQIFEEVEKAWKQAGSTPEEARERASAAQDYFGSNSGQIALGTALGALAGSTGVEAGLVGRAAPKASIFERANVPRFVREGVKEAIPEAAQGGQETLAQNLALQNEGFDVPTMQGVAGNAVLEGLAGGAFGAAASPLHRQHAKAGARALATGGTVEEVIAGAMAVAESTPLAPAPTGISPGQEDRAMSAMERQARADDQALKFGTTPPPTPDLGTRPAPGVASADMVVETPPFSDRVLELRQQLADPSVRDALRALDERAFSTVAQYASVADRPDVNLPEATRERILSLAEGIVSRALLKPIRSTGVAADPGPAGALPQPARAPAPQIGLDTSPTGTIRVDSRGNAAPETRADAIDTRQATAPRPRPDGMEQQVRGRPLPRDFQLVGEGTLTPGSTRPEPEQLPAPPGMPGKRGAFEAAEAERAAAEAAKPDDFEAISAVRRAAALEGDTALAAALKTALDERAHEAATSPTNERPEPTPAQRDAGNYKKGHIRVAGFDISIENPAGSTRSGVDAGGRPWSQEMRHHYGYVRGTVGKDKDHLDVFVKPGLDTGYAGTVFVIDQVDPTTGRFDEHKIVMGAKTAREAQDIYSANYEPGWKGLGGITEMTLPRFREWVAGDTTRPLSLRTKVNETKRRDASPSDGASKAFPADKLARLSELTERTRADVGEQFTGFVRQYGRARADEMLDKALGEAEKADADRKAKAQAEAQAAAERDAKTKAEEDRRRRDEEKRARDQTDRQERERRQAEETAAAARADEERKAKDKEAAERKRAEAEQAQARRAEIVALRRRETVLMKLLECLG